MRFMALAACFLVFLTGCVSFKSLERRGKYQIGVASWYGKDFHGRLTASGEKYNMYKLTAAHKNVPLGTQAIVENLSNGKRVRVRINDRGPFVKNRIIDLSYAAAKKIGMLGEGTAKVRVTFIGNYDVSKIDQTLKYYIQTGSFTEIPLAEKMRDDLARLNHESFITKAQVKGRTYYRVCIGPLKGAKHIMDTKKELTARGYNPLVSTNTCTSN